ncbi:hypothetical protein M8494_18925 [Serratia ureilytica]
MTAGRAATAENARKLYQLGARMLVLTGNPNNGVSNQAIAAALKAIRDEVGDEMVLVTGKMHGAGIVRKRQPADWRAGYRAVRGERCGHRAVAGAGHHSRHVAGESGGADRLCPAAGALAMTAIGTSQGADDADRAADCADEQK